MGAALTMGMLLAPCSRGNAANVFERTREMQLIGIANRASHLAYGKI